MIYMVGASLFIPTHTVSMKNHEFKKKKERNAIRNDSHA